MWLTRNISALHNGMAQNLHNAGPHLPMIGLLGAVGFPLFYFVWHDIYPQPYESFWLRLVGVAVCLPWLFASMWPERLHGYRVIYWYVTNAFIFPIFFGYMFLMNSGNVVWAMSLLLAMFLISLLLDVWNFLLIWVLGLFVAYMMYGGTVSYGIPEGVEQYVPVYLFAVIAIGVMNYNAQLIKREKMQAMLGVASYLAHELRTPLLAIRSASLGIERYLPALLDSYEKAENSGIDVAPIRASRIKTLRKAVNDVEAEVEYSGAIIEMLLMNIQKGKLSDAELKNFSVGSCARAALSRYPFQSQQESELVNLKIIEDFTINGESLLLVHVFFNLIKNSLYAISEAGKGTIEIAISVVGDDGLIRFTDTGAGMPKKIVPYVFTAFYSSKNSGVGAGIGLSFCKDVVEGMGGRIDVMSVEGEYTTFEIKFKGVVNG